MNIQIKSDCHSNEVLSFHHITKSYEGVVALDDVSMILQKGEVHAVVGGEWCRKVYSD